MPSRRVVDSFEGFRETNVFGSASVWNSRVQAMLLSLRFPPGTEIRGVEGDTEHVGWNKAELTRLEADHADHRVVDCRQNPAFPAAPPHQNGRKDCKYK